MKEDKKIDFKTLISIGVYAVILIVSGYLLQDMKNGIGIFVSIALIGLILLVVMHSRRAVYTCIECKKEFKISPVIDLISPHNVDKKYLKCPYCGKRGWHREKR
ncbi:MAG: hypothetical protein GX889_08270 [Clostridiales bacterium]|mgnify:CR=1 FL=1|uniref:Zinc ribbon domain-containing protein n=2 Tax=Eubacteriales TaxID=186802 RepID=A3DG41_ACET2|nr:MULTISPECIES: hypothetical protein [Eubacteriales]ABN52920.1 hypothetical protein Cthe_1698 [Acetivibrio thermocellus ATCC 27405]NLZ34879.1 hypothetical protein [Clostridiales bacterium]TJX58814.1 hypothetical protein E8P77_21830 [Soehngenia saccharolytica]